MAFATGYLADPTAIGAGETIGDTNILFTAITFQDELQVGRFAKLDTGSLDNLDASATPVIAGVVTRNPAASVEDGDTIDSALYSKAEYLRQGLITVDVMTADTPAMFDTVFIQNTADADAGKASTVDDASTEPAPGNAEFLYEVQTDVWVIRLF